MADTLELVFVELRERMFFVTKGMNLAEDKPGSVISKAPWNEPGKKDPAWFGPVQLKKNYVSCHLMPLYALPSLRDGVPPELKKRMQGKSCFNFRKVEPALFDTLERLIAECADAYALPAIAQAH